MANPNPDTVGRDNAPRCTKRRQNGEPCRAHAIRGSDACRKHAGVSAATLKARQAVKDAVARWGLNDATVDPGVVMVRLVSQSAERVALYSGLLGEAYEAAERLRQAHDAEDLIAVPSEGDGDNPEDPAIQAARHDLRRIFATGGVAALVGYKFDADRDGNVYATEEAIRGLARLEAEERDRCAGFAAKAIAAGLAERQVRLAERYGALMAAVFRGALDDSALPDGVRRQVEAAFARRMALIAEPAPRVIEGAP